MNRISLFLAHRRLSAALAILLTTLFSACGPSAKVPSKDSMLEALNDLQVHNVGAYSTGTRNLHVEDARFHPLPQPDGSVRITYTAALVLDEPWVESVSAKALLIERGYPMDEWATTSQAIAGVRPPVVALALLRSAPAPSVLEDLRLIKIATPQGHREPFTGEFSMSPYPDGKWGWDRSAFKASGKNWSGVARSEYKGDSLRMVDSPDVVKFATDAVRDAQQWIAFAKRGLAMISSGVNFEDFHTSPWPVRAGDEYRGQWDDLAAGKPSTLRVESVIERSGEITFTINGGAPIYSGRLAPIGKDEPSGPPRPLLVTLNGSLEGMQKSLADNPSLAAFTRHIWRFTPDGKRLVGDAPGRPVELTRAR